MTRQRPATASRPAKETEMSDKSSIFISHSSDDATFAGMVFAKLRNPNSEPWIDQVKLLSGHDFIDEIDRALRILDMFVILLSRQAIDSGWVAQNANSWRIAKYANGEF